MRVAAPFEPGISVVDLDRTVAFYRDVLGLSVYNILDVPPEKSAPPGLAANGYRIARLETSDGQRLKFAQPTNPPASASTRDHVLDRQGGPWITFIVEDLAALVARLKAAGVPLLSAETFEVRSGVNIIFGRDPEGNFLEFVEYDDITSYRPKND